MPGIGGEAAVSRGPSFPRAHYIVKALGDQRFPVSKSDLLRRRGDEIVRVGPVETKRLREFIEPIACDRFETAAALHNAIMARFPPG